MNELRLLLQQLHIRHELRGNFLRREAEILVRDRARKRLTKATGVHANRSVGISLLAVGGVGLDDDDGTVGAALQDGSLVFRGLIVEQALTREG